MCGIVGAFLSSSEQDHLESLVDQMLEKVAHRGPDGRASFCDSDLGFGFGHRRLSILDNSQAGAQPIWSKNERVVLVFNGEIYNHAELRKELATDGHPTRWAGYSDSETLVELLSAWGTRKTLESLRGMFAFAAFDYRTSTLTFARDIAGEKPLLWGRVGGKLGFASELSALETCFGSSLGLNEEGIVHYMDTSYFPPGSTVYSEVQKLPPGTFIELTLSGMFAGEVKPQPYWESPAKVNGLHRKKSASEADEEQQLMHLDTLLHKSIRSQSLAEVPVGAFLSGGIDSSVVSAIAKGSNPELQTFSLGFEDARLDEAPFAKKIALHLGTRHHEIYTSSSDLTVATLKAIGQLDEPLGDSSLIPSLILSEYAKGHVSAVITGDGGDELFGGYPRYQRIVLLDKVMNIPLPARKWFGSCVQRIPETGVQAIASVLALLSKNRYSGREIREKIGKIMWWLEAENNASCYWRLLSSDGSSLLVNSRKLEKPIADYWNFGFEIADAALAYDFMTYMPADILHKTDRASMASGLESRAPLLDREIIEFAFSLDSRQKIRSRKGKWHLRQILGQYVPQELWDRPKSGFSMPMAELLRNDLKDWATELIYQSSDSMDGLFNYSETQRIWNAHTSRQADKSTLLWNFLFLSAWLRDRNGIRPRQICG